MKIDRTLFWFIDGNDMLISLNEDFFGIATLLNRFLNEKYDGKKIKFINLDFATGNTFQLHPILPKEEPYYFGGHLRYYGLFDLDHFMTLNWNDKKAFVWEKAYYYLTKSAKITKNTQLLDAAEYAYAKGLQINLNPDFRLLEMAINTGVEQLNVALWIIFKADGMYSRLTVDGKEGLLFGKEIDKTKNGVEFFLEIYKAIEFDGKNVIVKGRKGIEYLPLKISLPDSILNRVLQ